MPTGQLQIPLQSVLAFTLIELAVGTLIGMLLLKASCWLYNRVMAGAFEREGVFEVPEPFNEDRLAVATADRMHVRMSDPYSVPIPSWSTSATVAFSAKLVETLAAMGTVYLLYSRAVQLGQPDVNKIFMLTALIVIPVSFLSVSLLLMNFLPTNFNRGMGLAVIYFVVTVLSTATLMLAGALFTPFFNLGAR